MSTSLRLNCNTVFGYSTCAAALITDALTVEEARSIGRAYGWRYSGGRDYCPGCSGSGIRPRVIVAVPGNPAPSSEDRPAERLALAREIVTAAVAGASAGTWCARSSPPGLPEGLTGVEYVTGGVDGTDCVARTGPAGNTLARGDANYIALMDPEVGRAVVGVLHDAYENVTQEQGLVEDSLSQAAVDLADALLRARDERFAG